jgi:hypothetical protein
MMSILSKDKEDQVIDIMREGYKGKSPITFGDVTVNEIGEFVPLETQLVKKEDYCIQ